MNESQLQLIQEQFDRILKQAMELKAQGGLEAIVIDLSSASQEQEEEMS